MTKFRIAIFAIILALGGYVFWWYQVSEAALTETKKSIAAMKQDGLKVEYSNMATDGFPYRVRLTISDVKIEGTEPARGGSYAFSADSVWAIAQPWNLKHVIFGTEGKTELKVQEGEGLATFLPKTVLGSITMEKAAELKALALDTNDITVIGKDEAAQITIKRAQLHMRQTEVVEKQPEHKDSPASEKAIRSTEAALRINDILLPDMGGENALGREISNAALLLEWPGQPQNFLDERNLSKWSQTGDALDIKSAELNWKDGRLKANGTLTLDEKQRLLGTLTPEIWGYAALLDRSGVLKAGGTPPEFMAMILGMMNKKDEKGEDYLSLPMTFQDGWATLGPLKLFELEPLL
ncbi:DUF2125 domain-containing protein [Sneathiella sp. P13V-1]|uniref:DUF2125 domain-containing protein n=1 Tax=Sneathiella sp. P13V-1 TaxID=2697366 RepID=UPI00187B65FC|nr:DUF2125 domain-containing protein [Sneathiella sp. P13V-1]MBE7635685.1 DUF2125 domain-containing protein [Sneathiella sp. P13V-1]